MNSFTIHGTRANPFSGERQFKKHGGYTTCFSLQTDQGLIIIDAGTGICTLSDMLARCQNLPPITLLFTHFHLDHIIGLPFFQPLYNAQSPITIMGDGTRGDNWQQSLLSQFAPPWWPVKLSDIPAGGRLQNLPKSGNMQLYGVNISWQQLWHPQGCLAYRLEYAGRSVVVATDVEPGHADLDQQLLDFCSKADVLIMDAQFTPVELNSHRGWGHGTWYEAVSIARTAKVRKLILTHHDRKRTDAQIKWLLMKARCVFPRTLAARTNMCALRW